MLLSFRSLGSGRLLGFYNLSKLGAHGTDRREFFTSKCSTGGNNVDELNNRSDVVDVDGWEGCIGHGSVLFGFQNGDTLTKGLQFCNQICVQFLHGFDHRSVDAFFLQT